MEGREGIVLPTMSYHFDSRINEDQLAHQRGHALQTHGGGILYMMFVLFAKDNTTPPPPSFLAQAMLSALT